MAEHDGVVILNGVKTRLAQSKAYLTLRQKPTRLQGLVSDFTPRFCSVGISNDPHIYPIQHLR
jgi:hypothetical protein